METCNQNVHINTVHYNTQTPYKKVQLSPYHYGTNTINIALLRTTHVPYMNVHTAPLRRKIITPYYLSTI